MYAAALEEGWTQIDEALDAPMALDAGHGRVWRPRNSSGRFLGAVSLRTAMAWSLNTVAVRLALDVGVDDVAKLAHDAGIVRRIRGDATMALGTSELDVLEHAVALSSIPNGGRAVEPVFVDRLVDVFGDEVATAGQPVRIADVDVRLPGGPGKRVMEPGTAWQVLEMMRAVVTEGTGRGAWSADRFRAGKTGTTSGFADAWFVGFTTGHTIVVWVGRDDRGTLGQGESGARAALPAWRTIADAVPGSSEAPTAPPEILFVPWAERWVGVPAEHLPPERLQVPPLSAAPLPPFPGARPGACDTP